MTPGLEWFNTFLQLGTFLTPVAVMLWGLHRSNVKRFEHFAATLTDHLRHDKKRLRRINRTLTSLKAEIHERNQLDRPGPDLRSYPDR